MRGARVFRLAVVLIVAGLIVGVAGPVLDHHFLERWPLHSHIFKNGLSTGHTHLYETDHTHLSGWSGSSNGVVVVITKDNAAPGADGSFQLAFFFYLATAVLALASFEMGLKGPNRLSPRYIPPPTQPPRAIPYPSLVS